MMVIHFFWNLNWFGKLILNVWLATECVVRILLLLGEVNQFPLSTFPYYVDFI